MQPKELDGTRHPRAFWGAELRRLREVAGLTQAEIGTKAFVSGSYVGQFEVGARWPADETLPRQLDEALNAGGHLVRLWQLGNRSTDYPDYFADQARREKLATSITHYSATVIPGLLQTAEYAQALFEATDPYWTDEEVKAKVAHRLERASIYSDPTGLKLWSIIDESALRRPIGGAATMRDQLAHLTRLVERRGIVIQVLPFSSGAHALTEGSVSILGFVDQPTVAYLEGPNGGVAIDNPDKIATILLRYDLARAAALSRGASLDFIRSVMEDYRS